MDLVVIGISALIALYMAWTIGANDFANSLGSAVGSRSMSLFWAVLLGALCELAGSILVGMYVSDTLRKGIVVPEQFARLVPRSPEQTAALMVLGMACALLGAALWLHIATWLGMPVSTTHAIVGAVTGFGIVAAGWAVVNWWKMGEIAASWVISPVGGVILAYVIFKLVTWCILGRSNPVPSAIRFAPVLVFAVALVALTSVFYKGHVLQVLGAGGGWLEGNYGLLLMVGISVFFAFLSKFIIVHYLRDADGHALPEQLRRVETVFRPLVVICACGVAFAHGANDVANAVGPLAAVTEIMRKGSLVMSGPMPVWILALGGVGIVLGLITYGHKVMATVGTNITELTPSRGVAASLSTTITVLTCTRLGWPVSTSHTIVGAIIGVGLARGLGAINKRVTRDIVITWLITVPAAAIVTMVLFLIARAVHLDGVISGFIHAPPTGR